MAVPGLDPGIDAAARAARRLADEAAAQNKPGQAPLAQKSSGFPCHGLKTRFSGGGRRIDLERDPEKWMTYFRIRSRSKQRLETPGSDFIGTDKALG